MSIGRRSLVEFISLSKKMELCHYGKLINASKIYTMFKEIFYYIHARDFHTRDIQQNINSFPGKVSTSEVVINLITLCALPALLLPFRVKFLMSETAINAH